MRRSMVCLAGGLVVLFVLGCAGPAPAPAPSGAQQPSAPAAAPPKAEAPAKVEAPAKAAPAAAAPAPAQAPAKPAPAAAPAGPAKVATFAGINALTDQSAPYGTRSHNGAVLRAKLVNDAGGLTDNCGNKYTIKVTANDMANDRNQAVALMRRFAEDKEVLAIVGPSPSTGFVAMVPVAAQVKIAIMGVGTAAPIKQWNEWSYRVNAVSDIAEPLMMKKLHEKFKLRKVALIYDQTQDGQAGGAKVVRDIAKEIGYEVVAFEAFRARDQDFATQLTTIKASGAEWVGIYGATPELAKVARQMADLGMKANMFTGFATFQDPVAWDLSGGAIKDGYTWSGFDLSVKDPKVQDFLKAYKANFNDEPTLYSIYGNDALAAYLDALKRSCTSTDREKFVAALGNTTGVEGLGKVSFKNPPTGENLTPTIVVSKTTGRGTFEALE